MAARIFGNIDRSCLTPEQLQALASTGVTEFTDTSCDAALLNTCGKDAKEIVNQYPLYNELQGVYTKWGDIALQWGHEDSTSDEQWSVANYVDEYSYRVGDSVYCLEDSGYKVVIYRAIQNVPVPAGAFNPAFWNKVCSVKTTELVGLPDLSSYPKYSPFSSYAINDLVAKESECADHTCVYISLTGQNTLPPSEDWGLIYCLPNGNANSCIKRASCSDNRQLISLSNQDKDLICAPVESTTVVRLR